MTALGLALVASQASNTGLSLQHAPSIIVNKEESKSALVIKEDKKNSITAEEYVRNYFSDIPIMIEISRCESRFRQYDKDGKVLRGVVNDLDVGVMQINQYYHDADSDKLGYDIMTIEGNTAYARHLFEKRGVQPWSSSSPCWEKTIAYSEYMKKELAVNK